MAWRVGEGGIRVTTSGGAVYSLPPDTVLEEMPDRYEGKLHLIEVKHVHGYENKVIRPAEDK